MQAASMRITVTLSDAAIARIDGQAKCEGRSRANMIRFLLGDIEVVAGETMRGKQKIAPSVVGQPAEFPSKPLDWMYAVEPGLEAINPEVVRARIAAARRAARSFTGPIPKPKDAKRKA